jgi:hypothetical protein
MLFYEQRIVNERSPIFVLLKTEVDVRNSECGCFQSCVVLISVRKITDATPTLERFLPSTDGGFSQFANNIVIVVVVNGLFKDVVSTGYIASIIGVIIDE